MKLDTQFLTVHPRTALWWEQRKTCDQCEHCDRRPTKASGGGRIVTNPHRCGITPAGGPTGLAYCIDAREPDGECGPHAKLFQPKKG